MKMWYSFGKFRPGQAEASRQYHSVVDARSLGDLTRAAIVGRRQTGVFGDLEYPQYSLAIRESRHVTGRARISYADLLFNRQRPDTVLVCRSKIDIKGMASSDAVLCGMVEGDYLRNYDCAIPYSALVPSALDNVLVIGRGYSISHDALALARMQPDMMALGAVAGVAAKLTAERGCDLAAVPVEDLQRELVSRGIVAAADLAPSFDREVPGADACEALAVAAWMSPMELSAQARLLAAGADAVGPLTRALAGEPA